MIRLFLAVCFLFSSNIVVAEPFRVATFNAALTRKGPGLLLRDMIGRQDPQIQAVAQVIQIVRPDILLINELDHDFENRALQEFIKMLADPIGEQISILYPYYYAPPQNTGLASGLDLNGDGQLGGPADAHGFGNFRGQYAMALLSRFPLDDSEAKDFSGLLLQDLPGADLPRNPDGTAFPSTAALSAQRLSSKGHWDVPISLPNGRIVHLLAAHPTPPVFDGPEDRNGKRNGDEILFWLKYLDGKIPNNGNPPSERDFVILGDLNADPRDGEGNHNAIRQLLQDSRLQDPLPRSRGAAIASNIQGKANIEHRGDPSLDTADWRDDPAPGNLRVDYVLPSRSLKILGAGVFWPAPGEPGFDLIGSGGQASSDHRLVWVDLE